MKITHASVMVNDQNKAEKFYTEILGFQKKEDIPMGEFRWLTVVSPAAPDGVELALEPTGHPAAPAFQKALYESGTPWTMFGVDDIDAEYKRLTGLGVTFRGEPSPPGGAPRMATFDDTCGNLIMIYQP